MRLAFLLVSVTVAATLVAGDAVSAPSAHPFLLWTPDEAAAIKARIDTDAQAKEQYARMQAKEAPGKGKGTHPAFLNLFRYAVLGDQAAGAAEKKQLMAFTTAKVPAAAAGNPNTGNAPWREDRTMDGLRYDVLHGLLSEDERKAVVDNIRYFVQWHCDNPGPWTTGARTGWLPNMQWPTAAGVHVLAVASRDPALVKQVFESNGGWKWYFDHYLADGFYMEEFGKYYSNIGAMILWCHGCERLGLDQYGWGYTGTGGATMRQFLAMLLRAGLPALDRGPGAMPHFAVVNMGDAGPLSVVDGIGPDGSGMSWWRSARMNGAVPKMMQPLWWEFGHRRFPEDGYGFFLAQLRAPGEEVHLPSLYFGLGPIDPKAVKPPPAPSLVSRERGFALLRADESPAYWTGPKPAVAVQFGMYYVHYVHDCFSILNFVAGNRMLYSKMGAVGQGYAGGDPWRDHVNGQGSGLVVDELKARYVDRGEQGCVNQRIRHAFHPGAKFVAVQAKEIYPEVDQERALLLTDDYLVDVFWLRSGRPRLYDWHVLSPATLADGDGGAWKPIGELPEETVKSRRWAKPLITEQRVRDVGAADWSATLAQGEGDRAGGVVVHLLGEVGTAAVAGKPPGVSGAGIKLVATRVAPATAFVACHVPFSGAAVSAPVERFTRLAQGPAGVALRVRGTAGSGIDDRVVLRTGPDADQPAELAGEGEAFTVAGHAWLRVGAERVEARGGLHALRLRVAGSPKLVVDGAEVAATVADGVLSWKR